VPLLIDEKHEIRKALVAALEYPYLAAAAFDAIAPLVEKIIERVILQEHTVSTLPPETAHWSED
jgi:hypothetical protein